MRTTPSFWLVLLSAIAASSTTAAFSSQLARRQSTFLVPPLFAAKGGGGGKGFGKVVETPSSESSSSSPSPQKEPDASSSSQSSQSPMFLESAPGAASTPVKLDVKVDVDQSLPPEERTKQILREQYGLKTLQEQRLSATQLEAYKEKQKKQAELKKKMENSKDLDIMAMLPPALLVGIDRFLKIGLGICGTLFVTAGLFITAEAWSKTSGQPLPENIDNFIVQIVEPNFTPGLLVLLSFSVSLGAFAALQLSSGSSVYREDK
jgi:hypothetical protein